MDRIHRKSALRQTSELILAAGGSGEGLLWERYEKQLPLCAFTANGLNCRSCFQGPCRINPFGDEPARGVCGADRDQIVMENLFNATLAGVLETARAASAVGADGGLPDIGTDLSPALRKALAGKGMLPLSGTQLFGLRNSFFSHHAYLADTLENLTRMGLIHYGFLKAGQAAAAKAQAAAAAPGAARILCLGRAPAGFAAALKKAAGKEKVLLLGQAGRSGPAAALADQGTPEFALQMGIDALVVAPDAAFPAIDALAAKAGIPVILLESPKTPAQAADEAVRLALSHRQSAGADRASLETGPEPAALAGKTKALQKAFAEGRVKGVAVLFGEATVKEAFFERTLALAEACLDERCLVLLGGDIGAQKGPLTAELLRRGSDAGKTFAAKIKKDGLEAVGAFGSAFELPSVVGFVRGLAPKKETRELPALFAFPEFHRTATWAAAVSLMALGFTVQIGMRLPFWGAPELTKSLLDTWPQLTGATLLASPGLIDPAAQARQIVELIQSRA